jgi:hypothetical protein
MLTHGERRIEPSSETLDAARRWLEPVRTALGSDFVAAYLTGSVLTQGFDPKRSQINVLLVARELTNETVERLRGVLTASGDPKHFDPLFLTRTQIEKSLDVFPVEWLEIQERHLRIEGDDVFQSLEVPRTFLRLQCEHELRGKHIQLRQAYLLSGKSPAELERVLRSTASSFATLFRTLLRLREEPVPADNAQVIERLAEVFQLDARGLLGAHLVRYSGHKYKPDEMLPIFRGFLHEIERLVTTIDQLRVA